MELQQLRYVLAISRTGSFSRAAEQCHVSQPSLSQQVQKLEDELGERLFDRLKKGARLTSAGELFVQRAARILAEVEVAEREVRDAGSLVRGRLNLGVLPTIAPYLLPQVLPAFSAAFPGLEIIVHEETTSRVLKMIGSGDVDLAITSAPISEQGCKTLELFREELLLALPSAHELLHKRSISVGDMESERLIVMKEGHCLGDQVLHFCQRSDIQPQISCRSAQIETVLSLVESGLGLSLIPQMATAASQRRALVFRSLARPRPERSIMAVWSGRRAPGRAAKEFLTYLQARAQKGF